MTSSALDDIVLRDERYKSSENSLVFNFSEQSQSSEFYDDQFSDNKFSVEQIKGVDTEITQVPRDVEQILGILKTRLKQNAKILEIGGSYLQYRSGFLHEKYENYFPMDISSSSMQKYAELYGKASIVSDAGRIPLKPESVDCVFSHTFLEHVQDPDRVLREVVRILANGGMVVHCDAWHCRWWQRYGIFGIRKFSSLSVKEKMIYMGAKITEFPLFRKPVIVLRRAFQELFDQLSRPRALRFGRLKPNYALHLYCDEDAASSIDPVDVIRFYESRGFAYYKKLSFLDRIFFNDPFVILLRERSTINVSD